MKYDGKGTLSKVVILAKMSEMTNNRQIVNNVSNEMAKDCFKGGDLGKNGVFGKIF